jgi:hypothetical protein
MAKTTSRSFTTAHGVLSVQFVVGGRELVVRAEHVFQTTDPAEIAALDAHGGVRRAPRVTPTVRS